MLSVYFFDSDNETLKMINELSEEIEGEKCEYMEIKDYMRFIAEFGAEENAVILIDMRTRLQNVNCFKIAEDVRRKNALCHIVFISDYQEDIHYCLKNLVKPSAFLTKPVSRGEYEALFTQIILSKTEIAERHKIHISSGGSKYLLSLSEILYFTTYGKKISCKTIDGLEIEFYDTMKNLETRFSEFFIRCHSGFLVNKEAILGVSQNMVTIKNATDIVPVSKKYKKAVMEYLRHN